MHAEGRQPSAANAVGGGRRGYAVDSQRTIATRQLAERCEHRLFLSAMPHNGYTESFTALMEMIDGRRFSRGAGLDERALRDVAVGRLKTELKDEGFKQRKLRVLPFTPSAAEQERFALLDDILSESARANGGKGSGDIVAMLLKKRLLSSPWSFATTMELYEKAAAGARGFDISDEDEYYQEVLGSGQSDEEEGDADHPEFTALRKSKASDPLVAATPQEIRSLIDWGVGTSTSRTPGSRRSSGSSTRSAVRTARPGQTSGSSCSPSTPRRWSGSCGY